VRGQVGGRVCAVLHGAPQGVRLLGEGRLGVAVMERSFVFLGLDKYRLAAPHQQHPPSLIRSNSYNPPPPPPVVWQTEDTNVFLGLDTNRLARWDMRDPHGIVSEMASPIVNYAGGKDYARGTKFRWGGCGGVFKHCRWWVGAGTKFREGCAVGCCLVLVLYGAVWVCGHSHLAAVGGSWCCVGVGLSQPFAPPATPPALTGVPAPPACCSCMATSGDGYVVVGADDGKVGGQQPVPCSLW